MVAWVDGTDAQIVLVHDIQHVLTGLELQMALEGAQDPSRARSLGCWSCSGTDSCERL